MSVRASTRVSIQWGSEEAFEDTDTLVLTIDGYSLDLRVFVSGPEAGSIDWSTVALVKEVESSTAEEPKLRWDHLIDSRPATDLPDEGSFTTSPNGDVQERGTMFNPKTGLYTAYIETWRRYNQSPGDAYVVLERISGNGSHAFLGQVGSRSLGISKVTDGAFAAWREEHGRRVFALGDVSALPALPVTLPAEWKQGAKVAFGGSQWVVRRFGFL